MSDAINHPAHYTRSAVEPINAIEAWELGFHLGNAVKYISRAGHKGDALEDLKKARWYLDREIERRGGGRVKAPPAPALTDREIANDALAALVSDLVDRRGLKSEWRAIDDGVKAEILDGWRAIVLVAMGRAREGR